MISSLRVSGLLCTAQLMAVLIDIHRGTLLFSGINLLIISINVIIVLMQ